MPASTFSSSPARCAPLPLPGEEKLSLPGLALGVGDELLERLRGHGGMHDEHVGRSREQRDRREVPRHVERQVLEEELVHGEVARGREHQRVAIRLGARALGHADVAGSAGLVLHHHGLLPLLRELGAHGARQQVRDATGGIGHDDAHGLRGIVLGIDGCGRDDDDGESEPGP
jgi:hypothetical protein